VSRLPSGEARRVRFSFCPYCTHETTTYVVDLLRDGRRQLVLICTDCYQRQSSALPLDSPAGSGAELVFREYVAECPCERCSARRAAWRERQERHDARRRAREARMAAPADRERYLAHLNSEAWRLIRRLVIERDGRRCLVCNSPAELEAHHRTYERLGHERLDDLATLCRDCHELFHGSFDDAVFRDAG
jgi:5-methylcytosine-specific restriction endonuclease McrA